MRAFRARRAGHTEGWTRLLESLAHQLTPASQATKQLPGSCTGQIAFEAEGEIPEVMSCNCSICQRKGTLMVRSEAGNDLAHAAGKDEHLYNNKTRVIKHRFCPTCGIHPFGEGIPIRAGNGGNQCSLH